MGGPLKGAPAFRIGQLFIDDILQLSPGLMEKSEDTVGTNHYVRNQYHCDNINELIKRNIYRKPMVVSIKTEIGVSCKMSIQFCHRSVTAIVEGGSYQL